MVIRPRDERQAVAAILGHSVRRCKETHCFAAVNLPGFSVCMVNYEAPADDGPWYTWEKANGTRGDLILRHAVDEAEWRRAIQWSHTDFLHLSNNLRLHRTISELVSELRRLERLTLYNKLQSVSGGPNPHALQNVLGPGHQVAVAGPLVAYVTRCVPVNVTLAEYPNCTVEVPVSAPTKEGTGLRFMDPLTKVLLDYPTEVVCSSIMPVRWYLDDQWYCSQPDPVPCAAPQQLHPRPSGIRHAELDFVTDVVNAHLVNPEQLAQRDRVMARASYREAVLSHLVANSMDGAVGNRLGSAFSMEETARIAQNTRNQVLAYLNPWFLVDEVGQWWWRIFSIISFISVMLSLGGMIARAIYQFAVYGWDGGRTVGRALLSCFGIFYIPKNMLRYVLGQTKEDIDRMGRGLLGLFHSGIGREDERTDAERMDTEVEFSREEVAGNRKENRASQGRLWPDLKDNLKTMKDRARRNFRRHQGAQDEGPPAEPPLAGRHDL